MFTMTNRENPIHRIKSYLGSGSKSKWYGSETLQSLLFIFKCDFNLINNTSFFRIINTRLSYEKPNFSKEKFENHLLTFKRTVKKCISGKRIIEDAEEKRNIWIWCVLLLVNVLNFKCWPAKIPICVSFYDCYRFFTLFSGLELFLGETAIPLRGSKLVARW